MGFTYLREHYPLDETLKTKILERWIDDAGVREVLHRHGIKPEFFARYFASKVIDYAAGIVEGVNHAGNCPVIGVMLVFFERKNIPLDDVFVICVNFKNAMIAQALEEGALNAPLLHEICMLIDFNFVGVVREYLSLKYDSIRHPDNCCLSEEKAEGGLPLASTYGIEKTTTDALSYLKEVEFDRDVMEELAEIEEEAAESLGLADTFTASARGEVISLFEQYANMIERLMEFEELSYALRVLIDLLEKIDMEAVQEASTYIMIYTKAIISDLAAWRTSVFVDQTAEDIHYLDKTLLSSIAQLQILLTPEQDSSSDGMEFF